MRKRIFLFLIVCLGCLSTTPGQVVGQLPEFLPRYKLIAKFSAEIRDQDGRAILLQTGQGAVERFDLTSRTSAFLGTHSGHALYLIPNGYLLQNGSQSLLQVEGTEEINSGQVSPPFFDRGSRLIEERFGILRTPEGRVLRDFVARTNLLLSTNDGFVDVSANGTVVFTDFVNETNAAVRWFRNGGLETLAEFPRFPSPPHVATDGTNVLWSQPEPPFGSVFLRTLTGTIELSTNTFVSGHSSGPAAPRMSSVAMHAGWTIFPRWATNNPGTANNLWRRSPAGEITQLTTAPAFVLAMGWDGGAIILGGDGRIQAGVYYYPPQGDPKPLGDNYPLARYFAGDKRFYAFSPLESGGSGLFEVEIEADPFGLAYPHYDPETRGFGVTLVPGSAGTYILERTDDFVQWSIVETVSIEAVTLIRIEVATPPGMFRLRKM